MPLPLICCPLQISHPTQVREVPGGLIVHWHEQSLTFSPRVMRFTKGVTADYGLTKVESDELEIHEEATGSFALAKGHVRLTDPVGELEGNEVRFSWVQQVGYAENVRIVADSIQASVRHIDLQPQKWILTDVQATGFTNRVPLLNLKSPKVEIVPGKSVVTRKPKLGLLGYFVGPFPDAHSSLTSTSTGLRYPTPSYKQGHGVGVSWASTVAVAKSTSFIGSYVNYARTVPAYGFHLATTLVKERGADEALPPRYDLGDRFDFSYFQNIQIADPASDYQFLGYRRQTLALSTVSNSPATGRDDFGHYSKPLDLTYEQSDTIGSTAIYGQFRAQQIRRGSDPITNRSLGWLSAAPRPLVINKQLSAFAFGEGMVFGDTGFHWGRLQSGVVFQPVPYLRLSGAAFAGEEWGDAKFLADKLDRKSGFVARTDLLSGPTKVSYLMKFDPRARGEYDREYSVSQAIGILQAYIVYREYPSQFRYGLQLRFDSLMDALSQRRSTMASPVKPP